MKTLSVQEMKAAEEAAVARGIGYLELMENAGSACTHALLEGHSVLNRRITILVGSGKSIHDGKLCDLAPTMLELLGLPQPPEITGVSLLDR